MNQLILKFADRIYQYIFGYPMGERASTFFKNLGLLTFGSLVAGALSLGGVILAGRVLGPEEYGKASLVFSLANFFIIPMSFGLNVAVMYYLNNDRYDTRTTLTTSFYALFLFTAVSAVLLYLTKEFFAPLMRIDISLFSLTIVFAILLSFSNVFQSVLNGLHRYKENAILAMISGVIFVIGVIWIFGVWGTGNYTAFVTASMVRLFLVVVPIAFLVRKFVSPLPSWHAFPPMIQFSIVSTLALAPNFLFFDLNRVVINYFFGAKLVGIFAAYTTIAIFVAGRGVGIFLNVFYPMSSRFRDKRHVFIKISHFLPRFSLVLIFFFSFLTYMAMILFGTQYPRNIVFILLTSFATVTFIIASIYSWFLASLDPPPYLFMVLNACIALGINLAVFLLLGLRGNLYGIFLGPFFAYLYQIISSHYYVLRKYAPAH